MMKDLLSRIFGDKGPRIPPDELPIEGTMPEIAGITEWINSEELTKHDLSGKVVLIDFWTYSCINCIRTLPHVNAWHDKYADAGLAIIGVHTPEFDFEKVPSNVMDAVSRFHINYPVALDNDYVMWKSYGNHYWPAHYFIDRLGRIRWHHFGEGGYDHSEAVIRTLLAESGSNLPEKTVSTTPKNIDFSSVGSPETYLGHDRLEYLGSPETVAMDQPSRYSSIPDPALNVFYLEGEWDIRADHAVAISPDARIIYHYKASKVNLVMDSDGKDRHVEIMLDGTIVSDALAGTDVMNGIALVKDGRLYSLIDARGDYDEHVLTIAFPDPGTKVYAFTFE